MKYLKRSILVAAIFSLSVMGACKRTVSRIDTDKVVDLSGRWNDTDSRLTAEEMMSSIHEHPWLSDFKKRFNRKPVIIVGMVENKSQEHIDPQTFINDLEGDCIKRGQIRVVENSKLREKLREERADQQEFASLDTQKKWGKELGADFMLFGTINSIYDQVKRKKLVYYQIDLWLSNVETNEKVWLGDKKIKKFIKN